MIEQLLLDVQFSDEALFENYLDPNEGQLLFTLRRLLDTISNDDFLYLWGKKGLGKTHLLKAVMHEAKVRAYKAHYFDCCSIENLSEVTWEVFGSYDVLCLDNIECLSGNIAWEKALFNLYNKIRERGQTALVVSSNCAATHLPLMLADLRSRLAWGLSFKLQALSEPLKRLLLQRRAQRRGFELSDGMTDYILTHYGRDQQGLVELLDALDKTSLQKQRKITIPFIRQVICA